MDLKKFDQQYFQQYLKKKEKYFDTIEGAMDKRIKAFGESDKGVQNGLLLLAQNRKEYLYASISAQKKIIDIKNIFKTVVESSEMVWDDGESYVDLLWIVSIGILLDVDSAQLLKIKSMIKKQKVHDRLVDFLIKSKDKAWPVSSNYFMNRPYSFWNQIIYSNGNNGLTALVKSYLQNEWYSAHKDLYWYDLHNSKNNTYFGYWSFESGAIVKILGINDSELKDTSYYPYYLVHYC